MAELMSITRRMMLKALPFAGAAVAVPGVTAAAPHHAIEAASHEDLTRYYAFLWLELINLSKEMGVDMHDWMTANQNGDMDALKNRLVAPPSMRATATLRSINADRASLVSAPLFAA